MDSTRVPVIKNINTLARVPVLQVVLGSREYYLSKFKAKVGIDHIHTNAMCAIVNNPIDITVAIDWVRIKDSSMPGC